MPFKENKFIYKNDLVEMYLNNRRKDLKNLGGVIFDGKKWQERFNEREYLSRHEFILDVLHEFKVMRAMISEMNKSIVKR